MRRKVKCHHYRYIWYSKSQMVSGACSSILYNRIEKNLPVSPSDYLYTSIKVAFFNSYKSQVSFSAMSSSIHFPRACGYWSHITRSTTYQNTEYRPRHCNSVALYSMVVGMGGTPLKKPLFLDGGIRRTYLTYFFPHFRSRFALGPLPFNAVDDGFCRFVGSSDPFTGRKPDWLPWITPHTVHFNCPVRISLAMRFPTPYITS